MRVLHVHSGNMFGGVERVLLSLAAMDPVDTGLEHEFALAFEGRLQEHRGGRHRIYRLGAVRSRSPWSIFRARRRLREVIEASRCDVVLLHSAWAQALFGATAQKAGVPQVYWVHDTLDGRHWLQRWAARTRPDLLLCSSRFVSTTLPLVYPGAEFELIYYPLVFDPANDQATREAVRADLGAGPDDVVIVQLGRLEPYKGHELLLEALGQLVGSPGWRLWIVGGPQRKEEQVFLERLELRARELVISDRVSFIGQRVDVPRVLAGADIFCQPNLAPEPFGLTFIEAMLSKLPVITGNFGGGAEAVGDAGVLVEPRSPEALAHGLQRLIDDPDLRRDLGERGPARALGLTDPLQQSRKLAAILAQRFSPKR